MELKAILKTENLNIGYTSKKGKIHIASNINIKLEAGKLITLIGGNGIGKSTLLKTITSIIPALEGEVYLSDKKIAEYSPEALAQNLSIVTTEKLPASNLTVSELIALGRHPYTNWMGNLTENDLNHIENAISVTNISHLQYKKYSEISDGQLQKVMIARALAQDTPLIILDEPTTHLDLFHKVAVFKLLKKLANENNKCILFSTHDIDLAIQLSDEIIVMTEDFCVQDQPCNLIEKGVFDTLFKDEHIVFDKTYGKFIVR